MNRSELYQTFVGYFQEGQSVRAAEADVRNLEQSLHISLPQSYRSFIMGHGAIKTPSIFTLAFDSESELKDVLEIIPFIEVAKFAHQPTPGGMPEGLLVYANDSLGNLFCFKRSLMAAPSDDSGVWFFDHEYCKTKKLFDSFDSWLTEYLKLKSQ